MANTKIPVELSSTPGIVDNSNATAITIDSSENVGIGTASPQKALNVFADNTAPVRFERNTSDGQVIQIYKDGSPVSSIGTNSTGISNSSPQAGLDLGSSAKGTWSSGNVYSYPTGNAYIKVQGTAAEDDWIGIAGNYDQSSGSANLLLQANLRLVNEQAGNYIGSEAQSVTSADITFGKLVGGSSVGVNATKSEFMRIDSSGRLGIGTSSPTAFLDINSGSNSPVIRLTSSAVGQIPFKITSSIPAVSNSGFSIVDETANANRLVIDSSGNVGIGAAPVAGLHIQTSTRSLSLAPSATGGGGGSYILMGNSDSGGVSGPNVITSGNRNLQFGVGDDFSSATGGTFSEYMRIDSSGNVGIGATNPGAPLDISSANPKIRLTDTGGGYSELRGNAGVMTLTADAGNTVGSSAVTFETDGTERMRINSAGQLLVGTSSNASGTRVHIDGGSSNLGQLGLRNSSATSGNYWRIGQNSDSHYTHYNQSGTGVYILNGGTSWSGNSDETIKENIVELTGVLDKVRNFRCVEYNLISDETNSKKIGFIAQDWQEDYSQVISQDENGKLGMAYTETIPVLLKAIQEQQTLIESLEARITALES